MTVDLSKANGAVGESIPVPLTLSMGLGAVNRSKYARGQLIVPCRKAINGTIQSANKPP